MRTLLAIVVGALLLTGCGPPNALDGSVDATLEFNDVLLRKQDGYLVVQYELRSGEATQIVFKLAVAMLDELPPNREFRDELFAKYVSISRTMLDNSHLPTLVHGTLTLDQVRFQHGGSAQGHFRLLFKDQRTLTGSFGGPLTEVRTE